MKNNTLFQFFHWHSSGHGAHWQYAAREAPALAAAGVTHLWLPPAFKGSKGNRSEGYDVYDLYDLGEFDQHGSIVTKYGSRENYLRAVKAIQDAGMCAVADVVLNHRMGGDEKERIRVQRMNPQNRNETIGEPFEIEAYTKFTFPGRKGKYSSYIWDHRSFSGIDHAEGLPREEQGIFSILNEYGEGWSRKVSDELGNFDFLMGADVELRNPAVREELYRWGRWYLDTTGVQGFRVDAIKHMSWQFFREWVAAMQEHAGNRLFVVGEYWDSDVEVLADYIAKTEERCALFDAPLHHRLHQAGAGELDLRQLFNDTLVQRFPHLAVTLVGNHDTQPLQPMATAIEEWFKPAAYACILLREQGMPCIFYPDWYGAAYRAGEQDISLQPVNGLPAMLQARVQKACGPQHDYFEGPDLIGWCRQGLAEMPGSGCAVVISRQDGGHISMQMDHQHKGKTYFNCLHPQQQLTIGEDGRADFFVEGKGVAVWIPQT